MNIWACLLPVGAVLCSIIPPSDTRETPSRHERRRVQHASTLTESDSVCTWPANMKDKRTEYAWKPATPGEWKALMQRHRCLVSLERPQRYGSFHLSCCWHNDRSRRSVANASNHLMATPVKQLVLHTPQHRLANRTAIEPIGARILKELHKHLAGGVLTFVGDSVSNQAFYSLIHRARASSQWAVVKPVIPTSNLTTGAVSIINKVTGQYCFSIELFRCDRTTDFEYMVDRALTPTLVRQPADSAGVVSSGRQPRHIVSVNIGLHFTGKSKVEFEEKLRTLANRMRLVNLLSNHYAFFRDVTPQHFKSQDRHAGPAHQGAYERRDQSATTCAPIEPKGRGLYTAMPTSTAGIGHEQHKESHVSITNLNDILYNVAGEIGVAVQTTQPLLLDRYDAHIEGRKSIGGPLLLDCTHWCAAVFDVFDVTLIDVLKQRYGTDGQCR
eukprot:m.13717 g.13717  ORF g.13717 m.13717 type:complete len:442 (+) comp3074_c0_seq1:208-1533(+)